MASTVGLWKRAPQRLHDEQILLLGATGDVLCLLGVDGEGFFAENVLAVLDAHEHVLIMVRMRRGNIDDVHIGIAAKLFVAGVRTRDVVRLGKRLRLFKIARADGENFRMVDRRNRVRKTRGDVAGCQDTKPNRFHFSSSKNSFAAGRGIFFSIILYLRAHFHQKPLPTFSKNGAG